MVSDNELNSFIQDHIDSFVKWDVLVYFSRSPEAAETVEAISRLTGKTPVELQHPLEELVMSGILQVITDSYAPPLYTIAPDFRHRTILEKVNAEMLDRGARLKLLTMTMESIKKQNGNRRAQP
jgi:hypothetical protein